MTAKNDYDAGWEAGRNTGMLLAQQQPIVIRVETTQAALPHKPRRWYLQKRWLLSAIFAALLLFGGLNQRANVGSLIDNVLAQNPYVQAGSQRLDVQTLATAAVEVKGRILATIVPTAPELPQATLQPTLGRAATVPQQDEPTPVAAQMPPDNGQHDVQPGNMPAVPAPPPPVEQAAPVAPAPVQPAPPTAAPTAEPQGEVVAASQDADRPALNANGEPLMDWAAEAAKAQAAQKALEFAKQWQGVKP